MKSNIIALPGHGQPIFALNARRSPKAGPTIAFVDVQYYGALIKGFAVVRNRGGGYFVGFPARWGNKKVFLIVEFSEPEKSQIVKLVLEEAKDFLD